MNQRPLTDSRSSIAVSSKSNKDPLRAFEDKMDALLEKLSQQDNDIREHTVDLSTQSIIQCAHQGERIKKILRNEQVLRKLARDTDLKRDGTIKEKLLHGFKRSNQHRLSPVWISDWMKGHAQPSQTILASHGNIMASVDAAFSSTAASLDTILTSFHNNCYKFALHCH